MGGLSSAGTHSFRWSLPVDDRTRLDAETLRGWADRLQASARTGLFFADNEYDRERYEQVVTIAAEMAGLATGRAPRCAAMCATATVSSISC